MKKSSSITTSLSSAKVVERTKRSQRLCLIHLISRYQCGYSNFWIPTLSRKLLITYPMSGLPLLCRNIIIFFPIMEPPCDIPVKFWFLSISFGFYQLGYFELVDCKDIFYLIPKMFGWVEIWSQCGHSNFRIPTLFTKLLTTYATSVYK